MDKPFFLTTGFFLVAVLCSCQYGTEGLHDFVNDAITPAVFSGVEVVEGNGSEKDGRLVVGAGQTRLKVTLENSRNTQYGLEIRGADKALVRAAPDFDGFSTIFITLECPEDGYKGEDEISLDITLHLVSPAGRGQPDDYQLPLVYVLGKTRFLHIIPNTLSGPVTKLTLVFAADIPGLSENNITVTVDDAGPFTPRSLERKSVGIYEIAIDAVSAGTITVEVAPAGYSRASQSVDVNADSSNPGGNRPGEITFFYAGAYGSNDGTTEKLVLVFNQDIPGPFTIDIVPSVIQGPAERKSTGVYELAVRLTQSGTLTITVSKDGYAFSPLSRNVDVHYAIPVQFESVTANGGSRETTTELMLRFDRQIDEFEATDIEITGAAGVRKGSVTLSTAEPYAYMLALIGVTASGTITVTVQKDGYNFSPPSRNVDVHYVRQVEFLPVETINSAGTTIGLILRFSEVILDFNPADIAVSSNAGAVKGQITTSTREPYAYTLELTGVSNSSQTRVIMRKDGYSFSPSYQDVDVSYREPGTPEENASSLPSIKEKFGITEGGTVGVAATFNALSAFISGGGLASQSDVIKLGDYIDLEGGLTVGAYEESGDFVHDLTAKASNDTPLLRLIVVGINSFQTRYDNEGNIEYAYQGTDTLPQHVVFQFQNIPVTRRMNPTGSSWGYYFSEMRKFLNGFGVGGNFLTGLTNAGVPDEVLWAPTRIVSSAPSDTAHDSTTDKISDRLWLPTEREMGVTQSIHASNIETENNQAWLKYYSDDESRKKYCMNGQVEEYWLASTHSSNPTSFCLINNRGSSESYSWTVTRGVAPAFCVGPGTTGQ